MRIYEFVIEKEMGYSLDKTVRSMFLFSDYIDINLKNLVLNVMEPLLDYIRENPKAALEKKIISDRTYSIITMKATTLTDEQIQFLNFIIECQKLNNNLCSNLELLKLIVSKDGIRYDVYNHKNYSTAAARLSFDLQNKYNYLDLGSSKKMIVNLKGDPINANSMLDPVFRDSYLKVDEEKYRSSLKLIEIKKEEKRILFN